ncbi:MAG TPA: polysaccharide deacetylase family protein [Chloroflexota bacterium]|nr:polysaccharide deacetylase family protein [Chloroflexota bacterium]
MRATRGLSSLFQWRYQVRHWPIVGIAILVMLCGTFPVSTASGQAFQPQPPADAPTRQAVCRPAIPAVEKTPGQSVEVYRGPAECNAIHLSFDNGADRGYAEMILDVAKEEQVQLSFGMTGRWAQHSPDLAKRIADEGHELINHTWSHASFTGFSAGRPMSVYERHLELDRAEELVAELTGKQMRPFFRPPYGDRNPGVLKDVGDYGYDYTMMWTIDSFGWMRIPAAAIVERCLSRAEPGAIILMHVGIESEDGPALKALIAGLRERGYLIVGMADLLGL